jgi:hypothetical protein
MIHPPTVKNILKFTLTTLVPAALIAFTSCSDPPPAHIVQPTDPSAYSNRARVGSKVMLNSASLTATIVSIDRARGEVVLKRPDGRTVTCKARPDALEFAALKVGDEVNIAVAEERALFRGKNSVPTADGDAAARVRARVPDNVQAIAESISTLAFSARITAIDTWNSIVTLQLDDGQTKSIKVTEAVNLGSFNPGDDVSVRIIEATVIIVQQP